MSCPVLFQSDEDDDATQITPPETLPSVDISEPSRKSTRIDSSPKLSYEGMQGRQMGHETTQEIHLILNCQTPDLYKHIAFP